MGRNVAHTRSLPESLSERLSQQAEAIAAAVWRKVRVDVAATGVEPGPTAESFVSTLAHFLRRSLAVFRAAVQVDGAEYEWCARHAVLLAETGKRIAPLVRAWEQGCVSLLAECWARSHPGEQAAMSAYTSWVTDTVQTIVGQLSVAYIDAQKQAGLERPARRVLAELMINGGVSRELAQAANHTLAARYAVLAARLADGVPPGPATVARAAGALNASDLGLCCEVDQRVCLLVPLWRGGSPAALGERVVTGLRRVGVDLDGPVGLVVERREELARAVQRAIRVERLATAAGIQHGVVRESQVVSELAIARDRHYQESLSRLIEPLVKHPELIKTLRALYRHDLDRTRTAKVLNVVRRTLSYRIERIEQLTGLSPVRPRGIQMFTLALAARDIPSTAAPGGSGRGRPASALSQQHCLQPIAHAEFGQRVRDVALDRAGGHV